MEIHFCSNVCATQRLELSHYCRATQVSEESVPLVLQCTQEVADPLLPACRITAQGFLSALSVHGRPVAMVL